MNNHILQYHNDRELFMAYMPFLKPGGLFIPTLEKFEMGKQFQLTVFLPGQLDGIEVTGEVSWITPQGVQNGTEPGVGVSFVHDPNKLRYHIETALGTLLNSTDPTYTM
ncbi:PilZ domain-containing protein [Thalassotalea aquiviva]|uniref:PilZ domain-containing protein n=1 Tax=Thalassotalea aquiviva TaxID=3242415 RepID=UPI00352B463D